MTTKQIAAVTTAAMAQHRSTFGSVRAGRIGPSTYFPPLRWLRTTAAVRQTTAMMIATGMGVPSNRCLTADAYA